jgi:hypothetical protein
VREGPWLAPLSYGKDYNMKKILLALGLISSPVYADTLQINIPCDPAPVAMEIMAKYRNALLLQGMGTIKSKDGKTVTSATQIFINQDTGTLAVLISFPNGDNSPMSCLVIAGDKWEPYGGRQPWDKKKEDL